MSRATQAAVLVEPGTLQADHLAGRAAEGKPVSMFGAMWHVHPTPNKAGLVAFALIRVESDGPARMCGACGGFNYDGQHGEPLHCADCGARAIREE